MFTRSIIAFALTIACDFAPARAADPPADIVSQPLDPDASLKQLVVRPGLKVELVAAEPLVVDPVAFAWGADGKLWVVEMNDYPLGVDGKGAPGGRIKFLEDVDGDGRYDRATVFLDQLQYPTAVLPWRNGVIACAVPEIFYAEDADGDGRAEVRTSLFSGLKVGNSQHLANGLRFGPDGWVHCANGATNTPIKSEKTGKIVNIGTRDFRIQPDTGDVEPLAGRSQFVRDCDDFGNWFGSNNSEPLFHFVLDEQMMGRNPHGAYPAAQKIVPAAAGAAPVFPISPIVTRFNDLNKAGRFTSACGIGLYRDTLLGEEFYGNAFTCEPVHNLVHREVLERDGASFRSHRAADEQKSEFLASRDPWFRPTMVRTGPDGALYVSDMYRLVIEHPEWIPKDWQAKLDLRAGSDRGRIYRIVPEDGKVRSVPRLDKLTVLELAAHIDGPNGTLRDLAVQRLVKNPSVEAADALRRIARVGLNPAGRASAIATLAVLNELDFDTALTALDDSSPDVRIAALRGAEKSRKVEPWTVSISAGERTAIRTILSAADEDPAVRFQAALALRSLERLDASRALGRLLADKRNDSYIRAAVVSSLTRENLADVTDAAIVDATVAKRPLTETVAALVDSAAGYKSQLALARLRWAISDSKDMEDRWSAVAVLLDGLARNQLTLAQLLTSGSADVRNSTLPIYLLLGAAREKAADKGADLRLRVAAITTFGRDPGSKSKERPILIELLSPQSPEPLQAAAIDAWTRFDKEGADELLNRWPMFSGDRKRQIISACLNRGAWTEQLVAAVASRKIPAAEIDVTSTQRLLNLRDPKLREAATKALAASIDPDRAAVVQKYIAAVTSPGDAVRGRELFKKSCGACHKVADVGNAVGPDLAALSDRSTPSMLTSIFDPNRAVESKYVGYTAVTDSGLTLSGLLVAETDATVTLAAADGKQQVLRRSELEEFVSTSRSFMPVGVEKDVSPEGAADLLAFLAASRTPPKSFAGNEPRLVRPEALRGEFYLTADAGEAYGDTLTFAPSPPRFTTWNSANDRTEWEFEVTTAGAYELSIEYACLPGGGGPFVVDCAGVRLRGESQPTAGRDTFRTDVLGSVQLAAGRHRVVVRSDGKLAGAELFDLTSLRLRRR